MSLPFWHGFSYINTRLNLFSFFLILLRGLLIYFRVACTQFLPASIVGSTSTLWPDVFFTVQLASVPLSNIARTAAIASAAAAINLTNEELVAIVFWSRIGIGIGIGIEKLDDRSICY
jgi:hypothetical protein